MEVSRALLLALVISLSFPCSSVHGRTHHHKRHKHRSIALLPAADPPMTDPPALPPVADPPVPPPEGKEPVTDPPALPPVAFPPAPPPEGKEPPAPAPQPPPRPGPSAGPPGMEPPAPAPQPPPRPGPSACPPGKEPPAPAPQPPPSPGPSASPSNNTNVFDVRSFGAAGDGVTDDTKAFKLAWVAACRADSGTLLAPRGYSFMINSAIFLGPCQGGITFQVEGSIMPPDGPDSWPANNSRRQWLVFYRADGLIMRGGGLIDGRGEKWWDLPCKPHRGVNGTTFPGPCDSPVALRFFQSSNLTVQGVKIRNSPQFHFRFDNCKNVIVDSITINSPANSPNTDGIHVENSNSVGIYNSVISNGDDCISIGAGSFNIDIHNITCGPSHGISIGSLGKLNSRACVTNITVNKATIRHSDNGVRIKTWQGGMGSVSSVVFENIHMDNVRNPIIIDQYYCLTKSCPNQTAAVYVSDISYTSIKGTYDVRSRPMHFGCSDAVPCTNITLTDVELLPAVGDIILDPFCWSAYGGSQSLTIPPISCLMEGLPRTIMESDTERC